MAIVTGLLVIASLSIAGPSGLLAWAEASSLRAERQQQLEQLQVERDALQHQVALLDSEGADPDLVSELIRKNLNVVHPDEVILIIEE